jgi:hypothetical protein
MTRLVKNDRNHCLEGVRRGERQTYKRRFPEWSRREPRDMDGQVERPSERE